MNEETILHLGDRVKEGICRIHIWKVPEETEGGGGCDTVPDGAVEASAVDAIAEGGDGGAGEMLVRECKNDWYILGYPSLQISHVGCLHRLG